MEPRCKYDREFKLHAVQLSEQNEVSLTQVARELGINVKLLYRWRAEFQQTGAGAFPGQGHLAGEGDEVRRLQRELVRVQMGPRGHPDILKKALGVLARPPS